MRKPLPRIGTLLLALLPLCCDTAPAVDPVEGLWEGDPAGYVQMQVFHAGDGGVYGSVAYGGAPGAAHVHRGRYEPAPSGDSLTTVIHEALTSGGAPGAPVDTLRCRLATRPPVGVGDVLDCEGGGLVRLSLDPR